MTDYGDLARRIRLGEDSALELNQVSVAGSRVTAPSRNDVADELGAFANGRGGQLVLGVDDTTRTVTGIPLDALDVVETWVRERWSTPRLTATTRSRGRGCACTCSVTAWSSTCPGRWRIR